MFVTGPVTAKSFVRLPGFVGGQNSVFVALP